MPSSILLLSRLAILFNAMYLSAPMQQLSQILLGRLNYTGRPAWNSRETILVHVLGALYQLVDVDQRNNLATVSAYFDLRWKDDFLKWNPSEFNGTKEMYLPSSAVWLPELYLYHSITGSTPIGIQDAAVQVQNNGEVRIFVPFTARALCPINVKYFPFDKQTCNFTFGSWSYKIDAVQFEVESEVVNLDEFYDNQEWVLHECSLRPSVSLYKPDAKDEIYSTVVMQLELSRQSFYYVFNLMIPTTLVTLTAIIGFHAPSNALGRRENKFRLGITTLLSMGVMLLMVVDQMPKFALSSEPGQRGSFSDVPLLGLFYLSLIFTISLGTCTSSIFVILEAYGAKNPDYIPVYIRWLNFDCKTIFCNFCNFFTLMKSKKQRGMKKNSEAVEIAQIAEERASLVELNTLPQKYDENHTGVTSIEAENTGKKLDNDYSHTVIRSYCPDSYRKAFEENQTSDRDELLPHMEKIGNILEKIILQLATLNQNKLPKKPGYAEPLKAVNILSKGWRIVIHRIVLISLTFYLSLVSFIIFCFFYPHWWY